MRDQQHAQSGLILEILQQIEDLGLDRDIERGNRFVEYDEGGPDSRGSGKADALALTAAQAARQPAATLSGNPIAAAARLRRAPRPPRRSGGKAALR
jgi:hypothetical protein